MGEPAPRPAPPTRSAAPDYCAAGRNLLHRVNVQRRPGAGAGHGAAGAVQLPLISTLPVDGKLGAGQTCFRPSVCAHGLRRETSRRHRADACSRSTPLRRRCSRKPDPSLAFARMKLSDFEEDAAPPAGAPPPVRLAPRRRSCRSPTRSRPADSQRHRDALAAAVVLRRSEPERTEPAADSARWSRGILRRARRSLRREGRHSRAAARTDPNRMSLFFIYMPSRFSVTGRFRSHT